MKSLYIHFPFCEAKCHYCDFYSLGRERTRVGDSDLFEKALRIEAGAVACLLSDELETVFFGGGTPSMTPPDSMRRALEPLWEKTRVTPSTEWTMEANPSSIESDRMREYRRLGVNRISLGVQATRSDLLGKLGRVHSREKVFEALNIIFDAGFENVSVDLLCGVPGQGRKDIEEALGTLTSFPVTHLSCYLLTLPPHHRMHSELPDEETQLDHLLFVDQWMTTRGFRHYEISNFALPGKEARHNLQYWRGKSYLGLGPSAHSYDATSFRRWKNISSLHGYCSRLGSGVSILESIEILTPEQRQLEKWMLALRLAEGFSSSWLDTQALREKARALKNAGLLEAHPSRPDDLRLTARGFALSDQVIATFI